MTGTLPLFGQAQEAISALRRDLVDPEDGPRISTMRNYRFAIVQYSPEHEYAIRTEVQRLVSELEAKGWFVLTIDPQNVLVDCVRAQPDAWAEKVMAMGKGVAERQLECGLKALKSKRQPRRARSRAINTRGTSWPTASIGNVNNLSTILGTMLASGRFLSLGQRL